MGQHRRGITEKELKIAAREIGMKYVLIEYLINKVRENQSKYKEVSDKT